MIDNSENPGTGDHCAALEASRRAEERCYQDISATASPPDIRQNVQSQDRLFSALGLASNDDLLQRLSGTGSPAEKPAERPPNPVQAPATLTDRSGIPQGRAEASGNAVEREQQAGSREHVVLSDTRPQAGPIQLAEGGQLHIGRTSIVRNGNSVYIRDREFGREGLTISNASISRDQNGNVRVSGDRDESVFGGLFGRSPVPYQMTIRPDGSQILYRDGRRTP